MSAALRVLLILVSSMLAGAAALVGAFMLSFWAGVCPPDRAVCDVGANGGVGLALLVAPFAAVYTGRLVARATRPGRTRGRPPAT